jgi:predicted RNA-binding protein associated with RNAse of E/G family
MVDRGDGGSWRWHPGDHVVLREVWRGRVWYARPAIVVDDAPDLRMFYVPPRVTALVPVGRDGAPLRLYADAWSLVPERRGDAGMLSFAFPDAAYAVIVSSAEPFGGYYVNLQAPLAPTPIGFDTVEHLLDAIVAPDRSSWSWKDEDELAEALARGLFTAADAAAFRAWGERAVAHVMERRPPFDRDWHGWEPDPTWNLDPALPSGATVAFGNVPHRREPQA